MLEVPEALKRVKVGRGTVGLMLILDMALHPEVSMAVTVTIMGDDNGGGTV